MMTPEQIEACRELKRRFIPWWLEAERGHVRLMIRQALYAREIGPWEATCHLYNIGYRGSELTI